MIDYETKTNYKTETKIQQQVLTNALSPECNWSLPDSNKLVRVEPNLNDVVEQSKERRKRKRSHKDCHKAVLYHCNTANTGHNEATSYTI